MISQSAKMLSRYTQLRSFGTSCMRKRTFEEFKELQRQMQQNESVPIYIRKGTPDKIIFGAIAAGLVVSTAMSVDFLKNLIFPKPSN